VNLGLAGTRRLVPGAFLVRPLFLADLLFQLAELLLQGLTAVLLGPLAPALRLAAVPSGAGRGE